MEIGWSGGFSDTNWERVKEYTSDSWLKRLFMFLAEYKIGIYDPVPKLTPKRQHDVFLMEVASERAEWRDDAVAY